MNHTTQELYERSASAWREVPKPKFSDLGPRAEFAWISLVLFVIPFLQNLTFAHVNMTMETKIGSQY